MFDLQTPPQVGIPQKIIQNNLFTFGVGGDELLMTQTRHFTIFKGFTFIFNAFAEFAVIVSACKTIVSDVKTSQRTAKTTPASAGEVVATVVIASPISRTTCAAVKITSSAVAQFVAAF